jgi:hypothetical protein
MEIMESSFLSAADKFADNERRLGIWEFWHKYDIRRREDGQRYMLAVELDESELPPRVDLVRALEKTGGKVAPDSQEEELMKRARKRDLRKKGGVYWPLVENPDLFLEFARIADGEGLDNADTLEGLDTDKNKGAALAWAREHGVLGLTRVKPDELEFRGASTRGGKADTVATFAYEAWVANGCLRLYEAATAEALDMDLIASFIGDPRHNLLYTSTPALAREWALDTVASETQRKIAGNAYPALNGEVGKFKAGWSFTNLMGAMWLQMFWLLTSAEQPQRCRTCDKIIAYKQPHQSLAGTRKNNRSAGYRTRKDKRFCDQKCRNRYTYLTSTKPRRLAAREAAKTHSSS